MCTIDENRVNDIHELKKGCGHQTTLSVDILVGTNISTVTHVSQKTLNTWLLSTACALETSSYSACSSKVYFVASLLTQYSWACQTNLHKTSFWYAPISERHDSWCRDTLTAYGIPWLPKCSSSKVVQGLRELPRPIPPRVLIPGTIVPSLPQPTPSHSPLFYILGFHAQFWNSKLRSIFILFPVTVSEA